MGIEIAHVNGQRVARRLLVAAKVHPDWFVKAVLLYDKPTTCILPRKYRTLDGANAMFCPMGFEDRLVLTFEIKEPPCDQQMIADLHGMLFKLLLLAAPEDINGCPITYTYENEVMV